MNFIKITPRKLIYLALAFFVIHFILQLLMLFYVAASIHVGIETGQSPWWDNLAWVLFRILSFPMLILPEIINLSWAKLILNSPITWILNSAIWSLVFYLIIRKFWKIAKK